eukprot:TRINITY_DN113277_c0_g1_i1.p1 TRINITY_DN113277_c0_g1~~TRINITY_DN113277_c0_g1_i1.p1  ORF type:complete len:244 (+),score=12.72 TRINITY_DN113277_c0_g1_i1:36-767(+)
MGVTEGSIACLIIFIVLMSMCFQTGMIAMLIVYVVKYNPPALLAPDEAHILYILVWVAIGCIGAWMLLTCFDRMFCAKAKEEHEGYAKCMNCVYLVLGAGLVGAVAALGILSIKYGNQEHSLEDVQQNWDKLVQQKHTYICKLEEKYDCSGWSDNCTLSACPADCNYNENVTPCMETVMFDDLHDVWGAIPKWGIAFVTIAGVQLFLGVCCACLLCCVICCAAVGIWKLAEKIDEEESQPILA